MFTSLCCTNSPLKERYHHSLSTLPDENPPEHLLSSGPPEELPDLYCVVEDPPSPQLVVSPGLP